MIKFKNGKLRARGTIIEIMGEYAFITGAIAQQLKKQGTRNVEERMIKAVNYGLRNYEKMEQKHENRRVYSNQKGHRKDRSY